MSRAISAVALALLVVQPVKAQSETQDVVLALDAAGKCHMSFAGKDSVGTDSASIAALGLDTKRHVHLVADTSVSYRCVGRVIYRLQANGFRDIGFDAGRPSH